MDTATENDVRARGANGDQADGDRAKRERSKIEFPYSDLESAVDMAAILQSHAGVSCEATQLASWMNQTATGGTFRSRLGAAKLFDLLATEGGSVALTRLGREVIDDATQRAARVEAFLNAPLFRAMYEQYKGFALPPAAAIERQMEQFGVPSKQKERARQTFMKSANYAGFIDPSNGRFIKPALPSPAPSVGSVPTPSKSGGNGGGEGGDGLTLDPLLMALLRMIPPSGNEWPKEQRVRWFRTFAMNVSQVYDAPDSAVDLDIKLAKGASE